MRRPDSVTTTIWLAVVVAMVLGFSLQREVTTVLPYFGFERRQELPVVEERFLLQLPGRVAALLDILDRTPVADRPTVLAAAQIPQVNLRLLDTPAPNLGDRGEPDAEVMRHRIETALTAPRPVIVADRYRLADQKAGPAGGRVENGTWIEASLANGQWLLVVTNLDPTPPNDPVAAEFSALSFAGLAGPLPCLGDPPVGRGSQAGRKAAFGTFRSGRSPRPQRGRSIGSAARAARDRRNHQGFQSNARTAPPLQ